MYKINPKHWNTPLSKPDMEHYYRLVKWILQFCPSLHQDRLANLAIQLYFMMTDSPNRDQSPNGLQKLSSGIYNLVKEITAGLPYVHVVITKEGLSVAASELTLPEGLEQPVLVWVENKGAEAVSRVDLSSSWGDGEAMGGLWVPDGDIRPYMITLKQGQADTVELSVMQGKPAVKVPVRKLGTATLRVSMMADGKLWPARASVYGADGVLRYAGAYSENNTLSYKPVLGVDTRPIQYRLPFFYTDGELEITVPAGPVTVQMERGFEHPIVTKRRTLRAGQKVGMRLDSRREVDMKARGWVSGDTHVHWAKNSWDVNEDITLLGMVQRAEDLRVVNNLTLKHWVRGTNVRFVAPTQYPMGPVPGMCDQEYHIQMAEEFRNQAWYGHINLLAIKKLIEPISTGPDMGDMADYPNNVPAIDETHRQGGIVCEAHGLGLNWDVPVNVINGKIDCLDQMMELDYYRFLDCGFRLPLGNGSDHPARVAGVARMYVLNAAGGLHDGWIQGIRNRAIFVTSGALIGLTVDGKPIGELMTLQKGQKVRIQAWGRSRRELGTLQIVVNGKVVAQKSTKGHTAELDVNLAIDEPSWVCARCSPIPWSYWVFTGADIAHTSAIYLDVEGRRRFNAKAAIWFAKQMQQHAGDVEAKALFDTADQRRESVDYIRKGAEAYRLLVKQKGYKS